MGETCMAFCLGLAEIVEIRPLADEKGSEYYVHYKNCKEGEW